MGDRPKKVLLEIQTGETEAGGKARLRTFLDDARSGRPLDPSMLAALEDILAGADPIKALDLKGARKRGRKPNPLEVVLTHAFAVGRLVRSGQTREQAICCVAAKFNLSEKTIEKDYDQGRKLIKTLQDAFGAYVQTFLRSLPVIP